MIFYRLYDSNKAREYTYTDDKENILKLVVDALVPHISVHPSTVRPGDDIQITMKLENRNDQSPAYDVNGSINGSFFMIPLDYETLVYNEKVTNRFVKFVPKSFTAPDDKLYVSVFGTYTVSTGEKFNFTTGQYVTLNMTEEVVVDPIPEVNETNVTEPNDTTPEIPVPDVPLPDPTPAPDPTPEPKKKGLAGLINAIATFFQNLF